jgi:hypothetical protein
MIRKFESLCIKDRNTPQNKRSWSQLSLAVDTPKDEDRRFRIDKKSYYGWMSGKVFPGSTKRQEMDSFYPGSAVGTTYGERAAKDSLQTMLCAFDLISASSSYSRLDSVTEADEIALAIHNGLRHYMPIEIVQLTDLGRKSDYQFSLIPKLGDNIAGGQVSNRYSRLTDSAAVKTTKHVHNLARRYDPYSSFDAILIYTVLPQMNPDTDKPLSDVNSEHALTVKKALLFDLISLGITGYLQMMQRYTHEFYSGGTLVERYRLIHKLYIDNSRLGYRKLKIHLRRYLTNELRQFLPYEAKILAGLLRLRELFDNFCSESGMTREDLISQLALLNPDEVLEVEDWWRKKSLR